MIINGLKGSRRRPGYFPLGWLLSLGLFFVTFPSAAMDLMIGDGPQNYRPLSKVVGLSVPASNSNMSTLAFERLSLKISAQAHTVSGAAGIPGVREANLRAVPGRPPLPIRRPSQPRQTITFTDRNDPFAFQDNEKYVIQDMIRLLPAADLTGIKSIQADIYRNDGIFDSLLPDGVVQLNLLPIEARSTDGFYPLLAYHFTDAVGQNAYSALLTEQERQDWAGLLSPGSSPQQQFGLAYSLWTLSSNDLINQALVNPSSATVSLAQALFVSSLFLTSRTQITGYTAIDFQNNLIQAGTVSLAISYRASAASTDGLLTIGGFNFTIRNNAIIAWSSGGGKTTILNPAVALPAAWLSCYAVSTDRGAQCYISGGKITK